MNIDYNKLNNDLQFNSICQTKVGLEEYIMNELGINSTNFKVKMNPFTKTLKARVLIDQYINLNIKVSQKNTKIEFKSRF